MALYESVFIARQDVSATQVDSLTDSFEKIISDNGGSVERREYWGLRTLAYRIKKNRKGHYVMLNLEAPSGAVQEMERNMRLNEDILRYMTIRIEKMREEPSPIMQNECWTTKRWRWRSRQQPTPIFQTPQIMPFHRTECAVN